MVTKHLMINTMKLIGKSILSLIFLFTAIQFIKSQETENTDSIFKIFQFPANAIPCVDGNASDWDMVPASYIVGNDKLHEDFNLYSTLDTNNLSIKVKVGWVKGLNRLYFLYEAYDNYWDFSKPGLHHDIFEVVVDGDRSAGTFIDRFHPLKGKIDSWDTFYGYHGVQAQNYHIFTPAKDEDWCLAWGCQPWIKELPWANAAYHYNFKPGEAGRLTLEFWITPFDYAGPEGPSRAVESILTENKIIGLAWAVIDFDNVNAEKNNGFWSIAKQHKFFGDAQFLQPFKLMPTEACYRKKLEANWTFSILDYDKRSVAFKDKSEGKITTWKWDFGDGTFSNEQDPIHVYAKGGQYIVNLYVEGPDGSSKKAKVWDVTLK
jgi:hypothetical protein